MRVVPPDLIDNAGTRRLPGWEIYRWRDASARYVRSDMSDAGLKGFGGRNWRVYAYAVMSLFFLAD